MENSRRYMPLSLVLLLATTTGAAHAGSALDPYAHIAAPPPKERKKQQPVQTPDNVTKTQTYTVTIPMGGGSEGRPSAASSSSSKDGNGIFGSVSNAFKAVGDKMSDGAKASGDLMKKSASAIGTGLKSTTDKIVDGTQATGDKIASSTPKKEKAKSPERQATVEDLYIERTKKALANVNEKQTKKAIAVDTKKKDKSKETQVKRAYLPPASKKKDSKFKFGNPFKGLSGPTLARKRKDSATDASPPSGFMEGVTANQNKSTLLPGQPLKLPDKPKPQVAATPQQAKPAAAAQPKSAPEKKLIAAKEAPTKEAPIKKAKGSRFGISNPFKNVSAPSIPFLSAKKSSKKSDKPMTAKTAAPAAKPQGNDLVKQNTANQVAVQAKPQERKGSALDMLAPKNQVAEGWNGNGNAQPKAVTPTAVKPTQVKPTAVTPKNADLKPAIAKKPEVKAPGKTADDSKLSGMKTAVGKGLSKFKFFGKKNEQQKQTASKSQWEAL